MKGLFLLLNFSPTFLKILHDLSKRIDSYLKVRRRLVSMTFLQDGHSGANWIFLQAGNPHHEVSQCMDARIRLLLISLYLL